MAAKKRTPVKTTRTARPKSDKTGPEYMRSDLARVTRRSPGIPSARARNKGG